MGKGNVIAYTISHKQTNFFVETKFFMTLNPPPNLIMLWFHFMTISTMILYIFMTGVPIIKAVSMKGVIPIQFQLSHHLKLTLKLFIKVCHGILSWWNTQHEFAVFLTSQICHNIAFNLQQCFANGPMHTASIFIATLQMSWFYYSTTLLIMQFFCVILCYNWLKLLYVSPFAWFSTSLASSSIHSTISL